MEKRDIRAIENPISAIFDLADDVNEQAPKVRKAVKYSRIFVSIWLFVDFILIVASSPFPLIAFLLALILFLSLLSLRWMVTHGKRAVLLATVTIVSILLILPLKEGFALGILMVGLFILGMIVLNLMRELREFFDYYVLRHRAIKSVRDEDPVIYVPKGRNSIDRLLTYLSSKSQKVKEIAASPGLVQTPGLLKGRSGLFYSFDAYVYSPPSILWKVFGIGYPGYAIFAKSFDSPPKVEDLKAIKGAVEDVCLETLIPPSRVVTLWQKKGDQEITDEAYDFLTKEVASFKHRGNEFFCSLELVAECEDGTYDFIPYVSSAVYQS